jgi:catechol 2,3-dioxygenase-like lactoylglutathione lyase family enzyme
MKYAATILYTDDVPGSVDFYSRAFGFTVDFSTGDDYAVLASESGATISFASRDLPPQVPGVREPHAGFELWLATEDVAGAVERAVAAGAELVSEPAQKPWGQTVAYVRAPEGTLIELGEPVPEG